MIRARILFGRFLKSPVWFIAVVVLHTQTAQAQSAPAQSDIAKYEGLHKAAHFNDIDALRTLIKNGTNLDTRDRFNRTPLIVAAFASNDEIVEILAKVGADVNAYDYQDYDIATIAAVANDVELLELALELGTDASNITSPYEGTALIAAAHLGHHQVVDRLLEAGAPIDHVNNIHLTALIEAVILGDGGSDHVKTVKLLVDAGADQSIADSQGLTPVEHARSRGYDDIVRLLEP